jgi:dUTP pyrophosphatase
MKVKVINKSRHQLPNYQTIHSAGLDIVANINEDIILKPMQRLLIPTGLFIELPVGCEAQIRPRSGLALKYGITILNTPGTIDADYRGEIKVILVNLSDKDFVIKDGERICQMIVTKHEIIEWEEMNILNESLRGSGGFGHTGK